ncbi:MAG: hypothetical protein MUP31_00300 [Xanthomonadales bacterium]|nr:hypothetical protein [Xanthomonadales bacterium]
MNALRKWRTAIAVCTVLFCFSGLTRAQDDSASNDALAQANNPLANFTAFNVHDYYIGELTESNEDANQVWARFAKPFTVGESNWIMRASLPLNTYPVGPDSGHQTGIGDMNVFAAYLFDTGNPSLAFGFGPQITAPTASKDALGSEKWSAGFVNTLFSFASPIFQYGYLLSWQASFSGPDDRADVNVGGFQPFLFYQLGGGTYLRSSAVMTYDFENETYSVPIGLGIGKVFQSDKVVFNLFIEPQASIVDKGAGWAAWQVFIGLNSQFK